MKRDSESEVWNAFRDVVTIRDMVSHTSNDVH